MLLKLLKNNVAHFLIKKPGLTPGFFLYLTESNFTAQFVNFTFKVIIPTPEVMNTTHNGRPCAAKPAITNAQMHEYQLLLLGYRIAFQRLSLLQISLFNLICAPIFCNSRACTIRFSNTVS